MAADLLLVLREYGRDESRPYKPSSGEEVSLLHCISLFPTSPFSPFTPFPLLFFLLVSFSFHLRPGFLTSLIDKDKIFVVSITFRHHHRGGRKIMPRALLISLIFAILIPLSACAPTPEQKFVEAAKMGDAEAVRSALSAGMNINATDSEGRTALMEAASHSQFEIAKSLSDKGANVNAKDKQGKTALMYAAWRGQTDIAHVLMAKGADINAKDNEGETALAIALKANQTDAAEMLKQAGAKE